MAKSLIIVESPAKAHTIKKFFGKDFFIKASVGHLIDLPKNDLGVDIENNFTPTYVTIKGKSNILKELKDAAKEADNIYIAPDPDREGEAIAWHIANHLKKRTNVKIYRVLFNEITKKTVQEAVKNPREIDKNKVDAQQTRRILDRLVGYKISPILWKKVRRGLSAGRVQSIAMRVIYERENEIEAFVQEEYWTIEAEFAKDRDSIFTASLFSISNKKPKLKTEKEAEEVLSELRSASFTVAKVNKKKRKKNPFPPFITSTLQQDASRRYRYSAKRTMSIAQRLYEGIAIGEEGSVGLITYMRTDSTRISGEALSDARKYIEAHYGEPFLPAKPNMYKVKKGSQDAHEGIRPTSVFREPSKIKGYLSNEEMNIYSLIWKRFVSSQMNPALMDTTSVDIKSGKYLFRATGSVIRFLGFMQVYTETMEGKGNGSAYQKEDGQKTEIFNKDEKFLPELVEEDHVESRDILKKQHFTQPPPRYSEATLIKELEDKGIGRPSTYAQIMTVIRDRDYVVEEDRKFKPTELGKLITELLIDNFPDIMNIRFTADMENKLDDIEEGKRLWTETLRDFYKPFEAHLLNAETNMKNIKAEITPTDVECDKCGSKMGIRWGRYGKFLACMKYPECKNTKPLEENGKDGGKAEDVVESDQVCKMCGSRMIVKSGRAGKFLSCPRFPECKFTMSINTGVDCPECGGYIGIRYSKRGKEFYGCSNYPKCKFALWNKPIPKKCPLCSYPFLVLKNSRKGEKTVRCFSSDCKYTSDGHNL